MSISAVEILAVASGGTIGCLGRYFADQLNLFQEHTYNTIIINLTGCFLIGILWVFLSDSDTTLKSRFFITGLLGGFTTFSAFTLHPILMLKSGEFWQAIFYVLTTVIGGLITCAVGMWIAEKLAK